MNRSCSNKISCVFFSSRAAQNDNGRAVIYRVPTRKAYSEDKGSIVERKAKKKKNGNNLHFDSISGGLTKC